MNLKYNNITNALFFIVLISGMFVMIHKVKRNLGESLYFDQNTEYEYIVQDNDGHILGYTNEKPCIKHTNGLTCGHFL